MAGVALVLCAGRYKRWGLEYPKHLWPIPGQGETILGRTLRLTQAAGWECKVITHRMDIQVASLNAGADWVYPRASRWTCETWLSVREHWGEGPVAVLLGDVYWAEKDLGVVLRHVGPLAVFGNHAELFAVAYGPEDYERVETVLQKVITAKKRREGYAKVWNFYRVWCGFPVEDHKLETEVLHRLYGSLTTDIDTPARARDLARKLTMGYPAGG